MTSKEMEARSGVPRANIRYYETKGLLSPVRAKNGYREYSEEDLALLEKIKLLRQLGVSVEELGALRDGTDELSAVLDRRLAELGSERENLTRVEQVCGDLREAGETFESLDAGKYLEQLDTADTLELAAADTLPPVSPLRRLAARLIDFALCWLLMQTVFSYSYDASRVMSEEQVLLAREATIFWVAVPLQFLLEPLFLWLFTATPGKAVMGLRVAQIDGPHLSCAQSFRREGRMLHDFFTISIRIWWLFLFGFIAWPAAILRRFWKRGQQGETQPWDREIAYTEKGTGRRCVVLFLLTAAVWYGGECQVFDRQLPNQGDLTVEEFAENFNQQIQRMEYETFGTLAPDGHWQNGFNIRFRRGKWPEVSAWDNMSFSYQMDGDRVTGITIRCDIRAPNSWSNQRQKMPPAVPAAMAALGWGQKGAPRLAVTRKLILFSVQMLNMEEHTLRAGGMDFHSWSTPVGGSGTVRYTCEISLAE